MRYTPKFSSIMTTTKKQLIDWKAARWAGLGAGTLFYILNLYLTPSFNGGNEWIIMRLMASVVLGSQALAPPATFDFLIFLTSLAVTLGLALVFAGVIAYVVHRFGFWLGVGLGAILGLCLYAINFYSLTYFFPWFFAMNSPIMVFTHVVFGATAGGLYEALEIERFEEVKAG